MSADPLRGDPGSPEVRRIHYLVTAKPGCHMRCPIVTRLVIDLGKALGASESVVRLRYGLGDPESASEGTAPTQRADSAHSCPACPVVGDTTTSDGGRTCVSD